MLKAEKVNKVYKDGKRDLQVLYDIELNIKEGETVAVVGPSGAGKSTLLHILGGIDRPSSGKVFLSGLDFYTLPDRERASFRNKKIGFVFQFYHLLPEFTALENAMMPALLEARGAGRGARDARKKSEAILKEFGLGQRLHHRPGKLSGGEQQRVAIARAIVNEPEFLLCDEPTGNLDSMMGKEILEILLNLNKKSNTAMIIVTHDKEIAGRAHRILEIKDGRVS